MKPRATGLFAGWLLAGCIVLPVVPHTPAQTEHRGAAAAATCERLQPGVSRRIDVLLALGEPDLRSADDRAFAYVWDEAWLFFAVLSTGGSAGGEMTRHLAFLTAFDASGVLVRKELREQPHLQTPQVWLEELRRWR